MHAHVYCKSTRDILIPLRKGVVVTWVIVYGLGYTRVGLYPDNVQLFPSSIRFSPVNAPTLMNSLKWRSFAKVTTNANILILAGTGLLHSYTESYYKHLQTETNIGTKK